MVSDFGYGISTFIVNFEPINIKLVAVVYCVPQKLRNWQHNIPYANNIHF